MTDALKVRAGSNASPKALNAATVAYGTPKSYRITQAGGNQLLVPGPAVDSGSKNKVPRASAAEGQFDLGTGRYMGARSRLISTLALNVGWVYGINGNGIDGDVLFSRPNGKSIEIGSITVLAGAADSAVLTTPLLLGPAWCLAPGENLVFVPSDTTPGSALFVPAFVDVDLINFRIPLDTTRSVVLAPPPGKVWQLVGNVSGDVGAPVYPQYNMGILNFDSGVDHTFKAYINDGVSDVLFSTASAIASKLTPIESVVLPEGGFFLPGGHTLKVSLDVAGPDVFFCATVAEYNQADVTDETFNKSIVIVQEPA